jgi:hypothetical protein
MKVKTKALMIGFMILGLLVSACGGGEGEATGTPTMDPNAISTAAVATFSNGLTQTALAAPTNTPTPTSTVPPPATSGPILNVTPLGTSAVAGQTSSCFAMAFVSDVSIPDDTNMEPGETFTKTWRIKNTGTCAWDAGFKFAYTGGNAMNGSTYVLPQSVAANAETEISVQMTAPNTAGTARGNWRMSNTAGQFFGDEVYVQITVSGATGGAATSTPTP